MATIGVKININFAEFGGVLADRVAQGVAVGIRNRARTLVRKDSKKLMNSIQTERIRNGSYETYSQAAHAAVQEFGHPKYPNYGFTPHMRPAAQQTTQPASMNEIVKDAIEAAKKRGKR